MRGREGLPQTGPDLDRIVSDGRFFAVIECSIALCVAGGRLLEVFRLRFVIGKWREKRAWNQLFTTHADRCFIVTVVHGILRKV